MVAHTMPLITVSKFILQQQEHRPWPVPQSAWMLAQTWRNLLFAHWPLPPDILESQIPDGLELDTFDGQAWIGVVPFHMMDVRFRWLPPLPIMAAFPEMNVRTYVVRDGKPGVWFFSLDATNRFAIEGARAVFHLPYFKAKMHYSIEGERVHYQSERIDRRTEVGDFIGTYWPTSEVYTAERGTLDYWLTERYCLYAQMGRSKLYRAEIHHRAWPLQRAAAEIQTNTVTHAFHITLPDVPPLLHYAHRLDIVGWLPEALH